MSAMPSPSMLSPCSGVCTIAADSGPAAGHCIGCGRTLEEIGNWRLMPHEGRLTIMNALPARLALFGLPVPEPREETVAS